MADRGELRALSERVMALAGPDRGTLMEAFDACHPVPPVDCEPAWREENPKQPIYHAWKTRQAAFIKFVATEAWLCAAELLVPEGYSFTAGYWTYKRAGRASVWIVAENETREVWTTDAATPALALTAAALLALAEQVPA